MNNEVYTVSVTYKGKCGQLACTVTATANIRGEDQRDELTKRLREEGFDTSWKLFDADDLHGALRTIGEMLHKFPRAE